MTPRCGPTTNGWTRSWLPGSCRPTGPRSLHQRSSAPTFCSASNRIELDERRLHAIAAARGEIELKINAGAADLVEKARRPVATLNAIARDFTELQDIRYQVVCAEIICDPRRGMGAGRPLQPPPADIAAVVDAVGHRKDLLAAPTERVVGMTDSNLHERRGTSQNLEPRPGQCQPLHQTHHRMSGLS